jgi:hypothetical protein
LWRALLQITRMTPLRRMILQFSQSFLTDARTFIKFKIVIAQLNAAEQPRRRSKIYFSGAWPVFSKMRP